MKTVVRMDAEGRLTVPAAAREALRVEGEAAFDLEITADALILRPTEAVPEEDAWAYTPEHLAQVERALREGGGRTMSEADLLRLLGE